MGLLVIQNRYFILNLWLVNPPQGAADFVLWAVIALLINAFTLPVWNAIQAIGKLGRYSIVSNGIYLLVFPISFIAFYLKAPAVAFLQITSIIRVVQILGGLLVLKKYLYFSLGEYMKLVLIPIFQISLFSIGACLLVRNVFFEPWLLMSFDLIILALVVATVGLSKEERIFLLSKLKIVKRSKL